MLSIFKKLFGYERDQVEVEIETVTTSTFSQLDQAACLEICDHIKQRNDGPSIAMSTLLNQLEKSAAKDQKTASFTLTLLDICVKNCGRRFISELCKEDYLKRFRKLIGRGKGADAIQTRLLSLIKTWMLAFSDYVEFRPINGLYRELHNYGVQFPQIKQDDVDFLKLTLQPSQTSMASGFVQVPAASNASTTQLMKAIRHDLDQAALDLPAFEAQVQGLACTPPDDVTLRQLHATAERLGGLQGRLKAYVGPLSESMNPPLGSTKEKEATLDELMQVSEKINGNILEFQSFERMCRREEERAAARTLGVTSPEAAENPPEVPTTSLAASSVATAAEAPAATKTNAAGTDLTEKNDILQTLSDAREAIQLFQTLHQEISTSQVVHASQMRDLKVVVERLESLQKKINALIYRSTTANSAESTNEADTTLGNLTSMNDELLSCIRLYQMAIRKYECGGSPEPERTTAYGRALDTSTVSARGPAATNGPESAANAVSSALYGPASTAPSASSDSQVKAQLTPSGTCEAREVTQKPAAPDARTTHLLQAIRQNLDLVALDLPVFEAMVQDLACTPPDDVTLKQLHATADRLQDLQRRLEAYIELLTDPKLESSKEMEATLDELMRVNEKINVTIQQFQSFEKIRLGQEERAAARTLGVTSSEAAENPPEVPTTSLAASSVATAAAEAPVVGKTNAARTEMTEEKDILQTLSDAREGIQLFQTLHQEISTSQVVDVSQMRDLRVVVERVEGLQEKIHALIYRSTTVNSAELTNEADTTLGNLTSMNDELLSCIRLYQMAIRKYESGGSVQPERTTTYGRALDTSTISAWGPAATNGPGSAAKAASSALYGPASTAPSASSDSQVKAQETPVRTSGATKPEKPAATTAVATPSGARNPLSTGTTTAAAAAAPTTTMYTADATEVSRMIIQSTLSQARKYIQQFKALQESLKTSAAQMNDVAQTRELRTVGERLEEVQKEVHGLINEKLHEIADDVTEEDEKVLASLTEVNDELLLCVQNHRRTVREYESGLALRPEQSTAQDPATGTGAVPTWGQSVPTGLHSDHVPEIKTALDPAAVTGNMPANSQFVSQERHFGTEPGPGTGYEKTSVVPPSSADSQVKSQSGTDHIPGSTTAFGTGIVTGDMPANSQFVSHGPQFGTDPGLRTGNENTSVGSPTSADSQVQSQSETDNFPGLTTAFGSASITDHMPENSQFVPQEPLFGTEPGLHTGNEKTSIVPPISADVEMDIQDSEVSQHQGVAQHAFQEALTEQPTAALQMATFHALAGVKARVQSLSDLLQHFRTSGTPVANRDALQMKNLFTEINGDLQKLLDLRNNYERMKIQQESSLGAGGPADVDPLLLELYTVPAEACGVLADYKAFLNAGAKVCQEGDCDSATDG